MAERYLAHGESVVLVVRRHYTVLWKPAVVTCVVVFGALALGSAADPRRSSDPVDTVVGMVVLALSAWFLYRLLSWRLDRIYVTDHRLFEVSGVLSRSVASMPLSKMTDMTYRQTMWGRLWGYGEMIVETAGQDQALSHIEHVPKPDEFYKKVVTLVTTGLHELKLTPETESEAQPAEDLPDIEEYPVDLAGSGTEQTGLTPGAEGGDRSPGGQSGDDEDTGPIPVVPSDDRPS